MDKYKNEDGIELSYMSNNIQNKLVKEVISEGMKQDIERTHARRQRQWEFSMKMAFGSMVGMTLIITYLIIMNILG